MLLEPFKRVEKFLSKGDIRSIYGEIIQDTDVIMEYMVTLKSQVDAGQFPSIPLVRQLNHQFSRSLLFGQYTAQVFSDILGKQ